MKESALGRIRIISISKCAPIQLELREKEEIKEDLFLGGNPSFLAAMNTPDWAPFQT